MHDHPSCSADGHQPGELIADKYRLTRVLGEGGQACVWQARNVVLDLDVALKFVAGSGGDGAQVARLLIEARAAAKLRHTGIVRVFDFGQTEAGDAFLVLELLEGESLARSIALAGRIPPERALALMLPIAEALAEAHASGIVHRDIKPANIFLSASDGRVQPKLLDFGIAKVESGTAPPNELTRAGSIVGSPAYLSPEQARGEGSPDHRVDVWAFTATLYQALTGRLPFPEETYNALLWSIVQDEPRPTLDDGIGDEALWAIIQRGLAKSRTERWGSMDELGRELATWLAARGVTEDATGTLLAHRWLGRAATPASTSEELGDSQHPIPHDRSCDDTAELHPPLARSVRTAVESRARRRARLVFLAAIAGCGLGAMPSLLGARTFTAGAGLEARPAAALAARGDTPTFTTSVAAAKTMAESSVEREPAPEQAAGAPSVVPMDTPNPTADRLSNAPGTQARTPAATLPPSQLLNAPEAQPRASAAARPSSASDARHPATLPAAGPVPALAFAAKRKVPAGPPLSDPGAELLNPY